MDAVQEDLVDFFSSAGAMDVMNELVTIAYIKRFTTIDITV